MPEAFLKVSQIKKLGNLSKLFCKVTSWVNILAWLTGVPTDVLVIIYLLFDYYPDH